MPAEESVQIEEELAHSTVAGGQVATGGSGAQSARSEKAAEETTTSNNNEQPAIAAAAVPSITDRPVRPLVPSASDARFPRPNHFPNESWPSPPLARVASPQGRATLAADLTASACGSKDAFQRLVLSTTMRSYTGPMVDGLAHGHGRAEFAAGQVYEGAFERGVMHGEGCYTWPDGSSYTGIMTQHSATGVGLIVWPDGSTYQGDVVDGSRHGQGVFIDPTVPCLYEGAWAHGLRHGQGKLTYDEAGESYYEGQWLEGARHGYGLLRYKSGNLYEGSWAWDRKVGEGTMHWYTLNQRYAGNWLNDRPHGQGEYTWLDLPVSGVHHPDSVRSHGALAGMATGRANQLVTHFQHHNRYVGELDQGVRSGRGTFHYSNGSVYTGEWSGDRKHGAGRFTFANGSAYEGAFEHDTMADQTKWRNPYTGVAEALQTLSLNVTAQSIPAQPPSSRTAKALEAATNAAQKDIGMFDLPLDDLLRTHAANVGMTDASYASSQRDGLLNLLLRYNTELLDIYRFYAQLEVCMLAPEHREPVLPFTPQSPTGSLTRVPTSANASNVSARMSLGQLWAFVADLGLGAAGKGLPSSAPDLTLAQIDRVVLAAVSPANRTLLPDLVSLHDPRQVILLREFAAALIRLAEAVYEFEPEEEEEEQQEQEEAQSAKDGSVDGEEEAEAEEQEEPVDPSVLYAQALDRFNALLTGAEPSPPPAVVNELTLPLAALQSPPSVLHASPSPKSASAHKLHSRQPSTSPSRSHSRGPSFSGSAHSGPPTPVHAAGSHAGGSMASSVRSAVTGGLAVTGGKSLPFSSKHGGGASLGLPQQTRAQARSLSARFKRFLTEFVLPRARTRSKHGFGPAWTGGSLFHQSTRPTHEQPFFRIPSIQALVQQYERDLYATIFLPASTVHPQLASDGGGGGTGGFGELPPLVDRTVRLASVLEHLRKETTCFNSYFTLHHALDVLFGLESGRSAVHAGLQRELLWEECAEVLVRIALFRGKVLATVSASLAKERAAVQERDRRRQEEAEAAAAAAAEEAAAAAAESEPDQKRVKSPQPNSKPASAKSGPTSAKGAGKSGGSTSSSQKKGAKESAVPASPKLHSKKDLAPSVASKKASGPGVSSVPASPGFVSAVDAPTPSPRSLGGQSSSRLRTHPTHVSLGGSESGSLKKRGLSEDLSHLALSVEAVGPSAESLHAQFAADAEHFFCEVLHRPAPDGVDTSFPLHMIMG